MATNMPDNGDSLGGRLPLLPPEDLVPEQSALHQALLGTRVRRAEDSGYPAALTDGRLIGPFNSMLRAPDIASPFLGWAQALSKAELSAEVREIVILTVAAAQDGAEYAFEAHAVAAQAAGISSGTVDAIREGSPPEGLSDAAELGHRLATALVRNSIPSEDLYREAVEILGVKTIVTLVMLIGQYFTTAALLATFAVPTPR